MNQLHEYWVPDNYQDLSSEGRRKEDEEREEEEKKKKNSEQQMRQELFKAFTIS